MKRAKQKYSLRTEKYLFFLCFAIITILIMIRICGSNNQVSLPNGTYTCDQLPMDTIVFDYKDKNTFYYYFNNDMTLFVDKGVYYQNAYKNIIISSKMFEDLEIETNRNAFTIVITGKKYIFEKISDIPTINLSAKRFDAIY